MKRSFIAFLLAAVGVQAQSAWTNQSPAGLTDDVWSISYAEETFVAVTAKGKVLTSPDGFSWSVQTVAAGAWLVSVTHGAGLWVVVGEGGSIYYSADLRTWNAARAVTAERINGVCHTGKTFIAVTEQGSVLTSIDAQTWRLKSGVSRSWLHGVVAAPLSSTSQTPAVFASGGQGGFFVSYDEGLNWQDSSRLFTPATNPNSVLPTDSIEALAVFSPGENFPGLVAAVGGGGFAGSFSFQAGGFRGDGRFANLTPRVIFRGLARGSGQFVAVGEQGVIFTSPDASSWTQRFSGDSPGSLSNALLLGVAYAETLQRFVVVGGGGTILVSNAAPSTLINVSTRGTVTGSDPLIGGFVVTGNSKKYVLVRAVGPTLTTFGVERVLPDPVLRLVDSRGVTVASNAGWSAGGNRTALAAATARMTFPLPSNSADAALYLLLAPGSYTATVTSASRSTGTALFEAYAP